MRFASPEYLYWVPVLLAGLALFWVWVGWRRRRLLERFARPALLAQLNREVGSGRRFLKALCVTLGLGLLLFSMARPQYGTEERQMQRRGVEVVLVLDCSDSMLAEDLAPNRLVRAREILRDATRRLAGYDFALVAFSGIAIVQCPMTADRGVLLDLLDILDTETVPVEGSSLARAVEKGIGAFETAGKGRRVMLLLTDGEDLQGELDEAIDQAREAGVVVVSVGLGSTEGAPVPLPGGGFKEYQGAKVNSRLDFESLARISQATGGKAILANAKGDLEAEEAARFVEAIKSEALRRTDSVVHNEIFQYFLLPALLLLALDLFLGDRREPLRRRKGAAS